MIELFLALMFSLANVARAEATNSPVRADFQFLCPDSEIDRYMVYRVSNLGHLDEPTWTNALWSPRFHDILTG